MILDALMTVILNLLIIKYIYVIKYSSFFHQVVKADERKKIDETFDEQMMTG
jgi:hypothetical protein